MKFGQGVELVLAPESALTGYFRNSNKVRHYSPGNRRLDALQRFPKVPPVRVPVFVLDPSLKNVPAPRVDDEAPRNQRYAVERLLQEVPDVV